MYAEGPVMTNPKRETKQANALFVLFERVIYRGPQERRSLAFALFKAALVVAFHGTDEVGPAFAQRAMAWSRKRKAGGDQAASDMHVYQTVSRVRSDAVKQGRQPPPLMRLQKSNRRNAFEIAAGKLMSDPSTVEGAYFRHERLRKPKRKS
jgi:hypothetical protein